MIDNHNRIREISSLYQQILQELNRQSVPYWLELDLTFQQMKVLYILKENGPLKMSELSERLKVSMPTITGIVSRLVERRQGSPLITRATNSQDRRQVWAHLTEVGKAVTEQLDNLNRNLLEVALKHVSESNLENTQLGLSQVYSALKAMNTSEAATVLEPLDTSLREKLTTSNSPSDAILTGSPATV